MSGIVEYLRGGGGGMDEPSELFTAKPHTDEEKYCRQRNLRTHREKSEIYIKICTTESQKIGHFIVCCVSLGLNNMTTNEAN